MQTDHYGTNNLYFALEGGGELIEKSLIAKIIFDGKIYNKHFYGFCFFFFITNNFFKLTIFNNNYL